MSESGTQRRTIRALENKPLFDHATNRYSDQERKELTIKRCTRIKTVKSDMDTSRKKTRLRIAILFRYLIPGSLRRRVAIRIGNFAPLGRVKVKRKY